MTCVQVKKYYVYFTNGVSFSSVLCIFKTTNYLTFASQIILLLPSKNKRRILGKNVVERVLLF